MHSLAAQFPLGMNDIYDGVAPSLVDSDKTGWGGDNELLKEMVASVRPKIIVEVGTFLGESAITMGRECARLNLVTAIFCVDTWLGGHEFWTIPDLGGGLFRVNGYPTLYRKFLANVVAAGLQETIIPIPSSSDAGPLIFAHRNLLADLIYIDGSHQEDSCLIDLTRYYRILRPGGRMFGHDVGADTVRGALDQFCANQKLHWREERGCWILMP